MRKPVVIEPQVNAQESAPTPDDGDGDEPETDNSEPDQDSSSQDPSSANGELDMSEEVKPEFKPSDKPVLFALNRCRYKSGDTIVTAEAGDEIINPAPKDLQDLIEHNAVESFEPSQVQALLSLKQKDKAAKERLARAIGII